MYVYLFPTLRIVAEDVDECKKFFFEALQDETDKQKYFMEEYEKVEIFKIKNSFHYEE